jgi:hypothetical protein
MVLTPIVVKVGDLLDNDAAAASEIYNLNSSLEVKYCNIQGSYPGEGNMTDSYLSSRFIQS